MLSEKQIIEKKQYGDLNVVAQIMTKKTGKYIAPAYVIQILQRPTAKYYPVAIEALRKVVEAREAILNE